MLALGPSGHRMLVAVLDRIVPADADPAATGFGADGYVLGKLLGDLHADGAAIIAGLARLDPAFPDLDPSRQDAILAAVAGEDWFRLLARLTAEGVYADPANGGNRNAASWRMLGYDHRLPEGPNGPPKADPPPLRRWSGVTDYDVIVVGAGAGGGVAAAVLAESGKRVLLVERGREHDHLNSGQRDHLRNHRLSRYGHSTGPEIDGNPRIAVDPSGAEWLVRPHEELYQNNATGVGSGTVLYGGMAWRFHPDDFRMASRYGVPDGSSLADWPIGYDDLAPFYERAEWDIGVAGETGSNRHEGPRGRPYPMPPFPRHEAGRLLAAGAGRLGLSTFAPPLLINSRPRDGRGACIECGSCVGFPCPSDAKNGTHNTTIRRALAGGNLELLTGATVTRVDEDDRGRITGVTLVQPDGTGLPREHRLRAGAVVLSAGAIETARLLLLSRSARHPDGLGNAHDQVGRHLQGHYYPTAFGLFGEEVQDSRGPGVTIGTCDFNHGNDGVIGGALLADDFVMPPIIFWEQALPPELPRWGATAKAFMRDSYRHVTQVKGPVHEIPDPDCRVTLAAVRDSLGRPVARLSGTTHPETVRTASFILGKARLWLEASGARATWGAPQTRRLSAGQHQAGTCRMGTDPKTSVTDSYGRVWGHDNLFVCDAALHPTNGGYNPVLTIMAMAFRNADHIARSL
jgi:choline dehydrogenase-like flavoprotein